MSFAPFAEVIVRSPVCSGITVPSATVISFFKTIIPPLPSRVLSADSSEVVAGTLPSGLGTTLLLIRTLRLDESVTSSPAIISASVIFAIRISPFTPRPWS